MASAYQTMPDRCVRVGHAASGHAQRQKSAGNIYCGFSVANFILLAQKERENIIERQQQGIAAAKARGVHFGRCKKPVPRNFAELVNRWIHKQLHINDVLEQLNMRPATFYRRLRDLRLGKLHLNDESDICFFADEQAIESPADSVAQR